MHKQKSACTKYYYLQNIDTDGVEACSWKKERTDRFVQASPMDL